jgi:enoyl-CoA hydratase/carnithine racemase
VLWISSLLGTTLANYDFSHKSRDVLAKECLDIGLANYMAAPGETALSKAMEIAKLLCSHPQRNLRNDRLSVYATYDWPSMLRTEVRYGTDTLMEELPRVKKFNAKL